MTDQNQDIRPLHVIILILAVLFSVYLFFFIPTSSPEVFPPPSTALEQLGTPTDKFDNLLNKIKGDLGRNDIEVKVLIGPYFQDGGFVGLLYNSYFSTTYFILLDTEFYNELTPEEQEAIVAHEAGHILFRWPRENNRRAITEVQVLADTFAERYVHPKFLISSLDKIYTDYLTRKKNLERLDAGR